MHAAEYDQKHYRVQFVRDVLSLPQGRPVATGIVSTRLSALCWPLRAAKVIYRRCCSDRHGTAHADLAVAVGAVSPACQFGRSSSIGSKEKAFTFDCLESLPAL
jgi:hypothetical protein